MANTNRKRTLILTACLALAALARLQIGEWQNQHLSAQVIPVCGNAVLESREECDDGGTAPGDGCSNQCVMETGWYCFLEPLASGADCRTHCGDGIKAGTEQCDDGNTTGGDGCGGTCQMETGYICDSAITPACGDGIDNDGDGRIDSLDVGCTSPNDLVEKEYAIYVSTTGLDTNSGSINAPYLTLTRAQERMRQLIAAGVKNDLVVAIRGGEYILSSELTLTSLDSGNNGFKVIWRNYPGEEAKITTAEKLDTLGWTPAPGRPGVFQRSVPDGRNFYTLLEESTGTLKRGQIAQEPDWEADDGPAYRNTYFQTDGEFMRVNDGCLQNQFRMRTDEIAPDKINPNANYAGAKIYLQHADYYFESVNITSINFTTRRVQFSPSSRYHLPYPNNWENLGPGCSVSSHFLNNSYRFQDSLDFLDEPGEYYVDTQADRIYYWPRSVSVAPIYAPRTRRIFNLSGNAAQPVHDVQIHGLTLFGTDYVDTFGGDGAVSGYHIASDAGLVWGDYTSNVLVTQNNLQHAGVYGVYLQNADATTVRDNMVEHIGYNGISVGRRDTASGSNTVSNNTVERAGEVQLSGVGLSVGGDNIVVKDNTIDDIGYAGMKVTGAKMLVANNDIGNFVKRSSDAGGIYMWSNDQGAGLSLKTHQKHNVIEHNHIHDYTPILSSATWGLYLDGYGIDDMLVRNNLLFVPDGNYSAVHLLGNFNQFLNNIFILQNSNQNNRAFTADKVWIYSALNNLFLRNIFVKLADLPLRYFSPISTPATCRSDTLAQNNAQTRWNMIHSYGLLNVSYSIGDCFPNDVTWAEWQAAGHDANSVIGVNPGFTNALLRNFSLPPNSPAETVIGFKPFTQEFGVRDYTERTEEKLCAVKCGDGQRTGDETCDDGDATSGDGCSSSCTIETGFSCTGTPSVCFTTCGDSIRAGTEACDTGGNSATCDSDCTLPTCGDHFTNTIAGETCDKGANNGVEGLCNISCTGTVPIQCGNGLVGGAEECDDDDTESGDGCSSACEMEEGWYCFLQPMPNGERCRTHCGDGIVASTETCDDGNSMNGDGCDRLCQLEPGFAWSAEPITPACTDGLDNDGDTLTDENDPGCTGKNDLIESEISLYVDPDGNDADDGSIDFPLQTLGKAREVARVLLAAGLTRDLVINLRGGTYALNETFALAPEDSGNNGYKVIWRSFPGEEAIISGAERLDPTQWEAYQNGIIRMRLPAGREFFTLLQEKSNGEFARGHMAQEPDWDATKWHPTEVPGVDTYFLTDGARMIATDTIDPTTTQLTKGRRRAIREKGCSHKKTFLFNAEDLDQYMGEDLSHAKVYKMHADYFFELDDVTNIDFTEKRIHLMNESKYWMSWDDYAGDIPIVCRTTSSGSFGHHLNNRYRMLNALAFLDQPGEFFINPDENYLYYMPREGVSAPVVYAPKIRGLIRLDGTHESTVSNIQIHGLTLTGTDYAGQYVGELAAGTVATDGAAVWAFNVEDVAITNNTISNVGIRGISLSGTGSIISGNTVHDTGSSGISAGGYFLTVIHNTLERIGELLGSARGLNVGGRDNAVRSNRLEYIGYNGIGFFGRRHYVADNDISHAVSRSTDAGALYSYMNKDSYLDQGEIVLKHNYVHDYRQLPGFPTHALGIYLDGWGQSNMLVWDNLLVSGYWGNGTSMRMKGKNIFALNNIFAMDQRQAANELFIGVTDLPEYISWGNMTVRNILVRLAGSFGAGARHRVYSIPSSTQSGVLATTKMTARNNLTFSPPTSLTGPRINGQGAGAQVTWDQWQAAGNDPGSIIANPLLVNPLNGDFTVPANSPAVLQLGFKRERLNEPFGVKAPADRTEEQHLKIICGDLLVKGDETCDDGGTTPGDGCSSLCQTEHSAPSECGNGDMEGEEACDDGNTESGDGCSSVCTIESANTADIDHVIQISVDGLSAPLLQAVIDAGNAPTFARLQAESAWTGNARTDYSATITLPNHTSMITGRPVDQVPGLPETVHHGYWQNDVPPVTETLHNAGNPALTYVHSTFDVAHDAGLSTAHYASKSKFIIYAQSYNGTNGADHPNGKNKIDRWFRSGSDLPPHSIVTHNKFIEEMGANNFNYVFLHYSDPDQAGHDFGWGGTAWNEAVTNVDTYVAGILQLVETDPELVGKTAIILSADHGGRSDGSHGDVTDPANYTIPFFVWGAGVSAGDLYEHNTGTRLNPGTGRPHYTDAVQPIRNGDGGNLALDLLGLESIPGSLINVSQNLRVGELCGDGNVEPHESCDDGDTQSGDGCSNMCEIETGWDCTLGVDGECVEDPLSGSITCWDPDRSSCSPICGDGRMRGNEACDDHDTENFDGCSALCAIESGYACIGEPSICTTICGDGIVSAGETCDDDGTVPGDGCSATCSFEPGYTCVGAPSVCVAICGNGTIQHTEQCDDGNAESGDGCSNSCSIETGFACQPGEPSRCASICGDGLIIGSEACDDRDVADHDGCSHSCNIEPGFECSGVPSVCHSLCGDGLIRNGEVCDDNDTDNGDGCSSSCIVETDFACQGEPSVCIPTLVTECGNGLTETGEECDDDNVEANDGCSATCQLESGWQCESSPSECLTVCGDNIVAGTEVCDSGVQNGVFGFCNDTCTAMLALCGNGILEGDEGCDDDNEASGDGCSTVCSIETGFTCTGTPSLCATICGDGLLRGGEVCDDSGTAAGDGCSPTCLPENGYACTVTPRACKPICGDGQIVGIEMCDDADTSGGDGCSATCVIENGYTCVSAPSICTLTVSSSSSSSVPPNSSSTPPNSSSSPQNIPPGSSSTSRSSSSSQNSTTVIVSSSSATTVHSSVGSSFSSRIPNTGGGTGNNSSRSSTSSVNITIIDLETAYRSQQAIIQQRIEAERQAAESSRPAASSAPQWQTNEDGNVVVFDEDDLHGTAPTTESEAVAELENRNILRGQNDSRDDLDLQSPVNRAETVTLLLRFFGLAEQPGELPFSDTPSTEWYAPAIQSAQRAALVRGYNDGTFRPEQYVTVAEIVKMIVIAAGWLPAGQELPGEYWYVPYLDEGTRRNLFRGLPSMYPHQDALRGWVVQMLVNTGL